MNRQTSIAIAIGLNALGKRFHSEERPDQEPIMALHGLTLDMYTGETIALIGSNGSGKSTLLSILSGIVRPTEGSVRLNGKVASILDIGSNFLPDLTGGQNARMFLTINGIEGETADRLLEEIRHFSELGTHFDQPLKTYSNGMYLRLAFGTSFFLDADIYLVDEVINVGDQAFRLKIDLYFKKLQEAGKTLIIATHDTNAVLSLCSRCIWIDEGRLVRDDRPSQVIVEYAKFQQLKFQHSIELSELKEFDNAILPKDGEDMLHHHFEGSAFGSDEMQLMSVHISGAEQPFIFRQDPIEVRIAIDKKHPGTIVPQIKVRNEFNHPVFFSVSIQGDSGKAFSDEIRGMNGLVEYRCTIPANWLSSGRYFLTLNFGKDSNPEQPVYNSRAYGLPNELCFHVRSREQEFISDPVHYSFNPELSWDIRQIG